MGISVIIHAVKTVRLGRINDINMPHIALAHSCHRTFEVLCFASRDKQTRLESRPSISPPNSIFFISFFYIFFYFLTRPIMASRLAHIVLRAAPWRSLAIATSGGFGLMTLAKNYPSLTPSPLITTAQCMCRAPPPDT